MKNELRSISKIKIDDFSMENFPKEIRSDLRKIIDYTKGYIKNERDKNQVEKIYKKILDRINENLIMNKTETLPEEPSSQELGIGEEMYSEYQDFINELWGFLKKLHKFGCIENFVQCIETVEKVTQNKAGRPKSSEGGKSQKTPIPYGEINENNEEIKELIDRQNVLEGYDGNKEMKMAELIESKFFIRVLNVDNNSVEIDEYVTKVVERIARGKSFYLAIASKLGRGKTVLVGKIVKHICEIYGNGIILIFISNNPNMQTDQNNRIWSSFLSMKLPRRRKVWVIIDGLDEVVEGKNMSVNISRLKKAVDHYSAKVIIACRDTYYNLIYREKKEIPFNDRIYIYDNKGECFEEIENMGENIAVSQELLNRAMTIPLYATRIRIEFHAWCEADEEERAAMGMFQNDYTFMEFLVNNTLVREKQNYGSNMERYFKALYRIALMLKKFHGTVSVEACLDESNEIDAELIESDLIQNFVRIKDNHSDVRESVIQGFIIRDFEEYFFISGLCRALKDKDVSKREEWIADHDISNSLNEKIFLAGWAEMAGDQRERALITLEETREDPVLGENARRILNILNNYRE